MIERFREGFFLEKNNNLSPHRRMNASLPIEPNDLDRHIWAEELEPFVPSRLYDVHTHLYRWEFNTDPEKETGADRETLGRDFPLAGWSELREADAILLPGREVHRLSFGMPFSLSCDFEASNRWVADQVPDDGISAGLILVHPSMPIEQIETALENRRLVGFKPYRFYSKTGDAVDCRITDFLPEAQLEVADRHGLIITLHMARRHGIADPANLDDLSFFSAKYPKIKWILAHCARSYAPWVIESAAGRLREIPNLWYDISSVCDADVMETLCAVAGIGRVMYGSDNLPVGAVRGKYITFGHGWGYLSPSNHEINLTHCDPRMTFVLYEQLRAARRALSRLGLGKEEIESFFYNTAARLVASVLAR